MIIENGKAVIDTRFMQAAKYGVVRCGVSLALYYLNLRKARAKQQMKEVWDAMSAEDKNELRRLATDCSIDLDELEELW